MTALGAPPATNKTRPPALRNRVYRPHMRHVPVLATLALLVTMYSIGAVNYEGFSDTQVILNVFVDNAFLLVVAVGMTFVILTGGIDLSVGAVVALGGLAAAALTPRGSAPALLAAVAIGGAVGLCNGFLVTRGRIQPFITTLSTMIAARGLSLALTDELAIRVDRGAAAFRWLGRGLLGPVPVPVVLLVLACGLGALVLGRTRVGRHVYAVGDSEEAARLLGLDVARVKVGAYVCSGALAGLAGALLASRLGAGQPVAGTGWELDAIAAVVVGGTPLTGGRGGVGATLVGVLLLGVILNVFNLEGTVSSWWQLVLRGAFLLAVILAQRRLGRAAAA